jgi:hypothetical protein
VRGKEVAFDALGEIREGIAVRGLLLPREPLRQPGRKRRARDRLHFHDRAQAVERGEPLRLPPRSLGSRHRHQQHDVGIRALAVGGERLRAGGVRLAGGQAQLDQLAVAEERGAAGRMGELAPVEIAVGLQHFPLGEALLARCRAHRVGRFEGEQRLVAVHEVGRRELLREGRFELVGLQPHRRDRLTAPGARAYGTPRCGA